MANVTCPYCGKQTDKKICPRCMAEIKRDREEPKPAETTTARKSKTKKED